MAGPDAANSRDFNLDSMGLGLGFWFDMSQFGKLSGVSDLIC